MLIACWSVKGGSGTTVVSVALALLLARRSPGQVVLADLDGDVPAVLGLPEPPGPGLAEWSHAGADVPDDALGRLAVPAGSGLRVLPRGGGPWPGDAGAADRLAGALARGLPPGPPAAGPAAPSLAGRAAHDTGTGGISVADGGSVGPPSAGAGGTTVADCGTRPPSAGAGRTTVAGCGILDPASAGRTGPAALGASAGGITVADCGTLGAPSAGLTGPGAALAAGAGLSLLVIRPCFLALRRAVAAPLRPSGVVLVAEDGRSLGADDVAEVLGVPVRAVVPCDPAVARAVDAGLLATRVPRVLERALRGAA